MKGEEQEALDQEKISRRQQAEKAYSSTSRWGGEWGTGALADWQEEAQKHLKMGVFYHFLSTTGWEG